MKRVVVASSRRDRVIGALGFGVAILPVLLLAGFLFGFVLFPFVQTLLPRPTPPGLDCTWYAPHSLWKTLSILVFPALAFAVPIGFFAALWLEELSTEGLPRMLLDWASRLLGSVSTVLLGTLGFLFLAARADLCLVFSEGTRCAAAGLACPQSPSLLGALLLGIAMLPKVILTSRSALRSVPDSLREGAFALGSTRLSAVRSVVMPMAWPRIVEGFVVAMMFGVGELVLWILLFGGDCAVRFVPPIHGFTGMILFVLLVQGAFSLGRRRLERRRS